MEKEILISGFGGQGLMSLGKIIARAALKSNKHTIWFPSYGAEMRGGTAHCFVKISDKPIASPFIVYPDIAIILNQPSLDKFRKVIKKGILVTNKDLIGKISMSKNITLKNLPLNSMA
ncbi:MAG: 2-oxoacid:acceptor oxidoreductase family protein, partial [Candidatus Omnitrophica bacterium]|nr:2-oxoacid:acceptor oxidoreductase family protein [Candidatus Omnitrophota bacterium]